MSTSLTPLTGVKEWIQVFRKVPPKSSMWGKQTETSGKKKILRKSVPHYSFTSLLENVVYRLGRRRRDSVPVVGDERWVVTIVERDDTTGRH